MMNAQENGASVAVPARPHLAHDALVERYLHLLRADLPILAAAAHPGREHTLRWAVDELWHTAATLRGIPLEDAEYELKHVLQEARQRLGLGEGSQGVP